MSTKIKVCALLYHLPTDLVTETIDTQSLLQAIIDYYHHKEERSVVPLTINAGLLEIGLKNDRIPPEYINRLLEQNHLALAPVYHLSPRGIYQGETLLRNLLKAFQMELDTARLQRVIFLPAVFGLNSQLPQILRGFNIDAVILPELKESNGPSDQIFIWDGPDGSSILSYRLYKSKAGKNQSSLPWNLYLILLRPGNNIFSAVEHALSNLNQEQEIQLSNLEDCIWDLKEEINLKNLNHYKGEICGLLTDTTSEASKDYLHSDLTLQHQIKQQENELLWYVEPLATITKSLGLESHSESLQKQWESLLSLQSLTLKSSADPSTNYALLADVCSALKPLQHLKQNIIQTLRRNIISFKANRHHSFWLVFNPHPMPRTEIIEVALELPDNVNPGSVVMREVDGREIPIQILYKNKPNSPLIPNEKNKTTYQCLIELQNLPASGWATYHLIYQGAPKRLAAAPISVEKNALENDYMRVGINRDGTIEIFGKETGTFWQGMGFFMDGLFLGTEKVSPAIQPLTSLHLIPEIKLLYNNPLGAAYQLDYDWELPIEFDPTIKQRSSRLTNVHIKEILRLNRLSNYLDVLLEIDCNIYDHQMAICFPLDFNPQVCVTDGFFGIEKRYLTGSHSRCTTQSMGNFVGFSNEDGGIAFLIQGLREFNLLHRNSNIVAFTLIKDFGGHSTAICSELGMMHRQYRIAITPHLGNWDSSGILNDITRFNAPLEIVSADENGVGTLPSRLQFVKVLPDNLIFSSLKESAFDQGIVLRLFNPTSNSIDGEITTYLPIRSLRLLTLEEKIIENIEPESENRFSVMIPPRKIVTIKINFK